MPAKPMKLADGFGLALSVMPVLLNVEARLDAGTWTCAELISVCRPPPPPPPQRAVASGLPPPGDSPEAGGVTWNDWVADRPGATVPGEVATDGVTVQPAGALSDSDAPGSGRPVGVRSVAWTGTGPSASAEEEIAASVGCGADGGP